MTTQIHCNLCILTRCAFHLTSAIDQSEDQSTDISHGRAAQVELPHNPMDTKAQLSPKIDYGSLHKVMMYCNVIFPALNPNSLRDKCEDVCEYQRRCLYYWGGATTALR